MDSNFISALILAVIQGISEWLPISSSGHLALFSWILGYDMNLAFEVALHFGTLMAVFVYFGREITDILEAVIKGKFNQPNGRMGLYIVVSAIPAGIVGFLLKDVFDTYLNVPLVIGCGFLITSVALMIASIDTRKKGEMSYKKSIGIGVAQAVAIVPGISRSGSTIATGMFLGLSPRDAMKFSFLMSIPVIFGASVLVMGSDPIPTSYLVPVLVSFFVGLLTIHFMLKFLLAKRENFRWFAAYCFILGLAVLSWALFF